MFAYLVAWIGYLGEMVSVALTAKRSPHFPVPGRRSLCGKDLVDGLGWTHGGLCRAEGECEKRRAIF